MHKQHVQKDGIVALTCVLPQGNGKGFRQSGLVSGHSTHAKQNARRDRNNATPSSAHAPIITLQSVDELIIGCVQDNGNGSGEGLPATGSAGQELGSMLGARIPSEQYPRVDSQGQILSTDDLKIRGMHAAQYHKTSIEAMLHSRHAGATPYRTVLGDVSC